MLALEKYLAAVNSNSVIPSSINPKNMASGTSDLVRLTNQAKLFHQVTTYEYLILFHMQVTETHALQPLIIPPTDEPSAYKLIVTEIPRPISGTIVPVKNKEINDLEV